MFTLDDLVKISLIVLLLSISLAVVVQLGMILHSLNSILKDVKKISNTLVKDAYETRKFAIETAVLLIEALVFKEINKVKSDMLGGAAKFLRMFTKNKLV